MSHLKRFGQNVRKLRKSRGWSQEDLAEAASLHRTYVSGVERGVRNPTLSVILQIARGLKVKAGLLLDSGGDDE